MAHSALCLALALSTLLHTLLGCSVGGQCPQCVGSVCATASHDETDHDHEDGTEDEHPSSPGHGPRDHCVFVSKLFAGDEAADAGSAGAFRSPTALSLAVDVAGASAQGWAHLPPQTSPIISLPLHLRLQVLLL